MKWLLLLLLPAAAFAQTDAQTPTQTSIRAENPQEYGWFLGDELVQRIHVTLPDGISIDPASPPKPRAVDYWLDLRDVQIEPRGDGVTLSLRWQHFYAAVAPDRREVPASAIRLTDGTATELPGFTFVTSPLRPITAPSSPDQMQREPAFHLIDPLPNQIGLAAAVTTFIALFILMIWHLAYWPFHARAARPFTMAARLIARTPHPTEQRRHLHRAFDQAFGRVLIGSDLPHFLTHRAEFAPLAERIAGFFRASDANFFTTNPAPAMDIGSLARALSRIERGQR